MNTDSRSLSEQATSATLRLLRHLPAQSDMTLVVLKGHLLVEELLHDVVQSRLVHPGAIEKANLRFMQLSSLAEALVGKTEYVELWIAIERLNRIRNQLAHHLEPRALDQMIEEFLKAVPIAVLAGGPFVETVKSIGTDSRVQDVRASIAFLSGVLSVLVQGEIRGGAG